jgi:hypothetical protein
MSKHKHRDRLAEFVRSQQFSNAGSRGLSERMLSEREGRRPEDLGYGFLIFGIAVTACSALGVLSVLLQRRFEWNTLMPVISLGLFGLILLGTGISMVPRSFKKKIVRRLRP